MVVFTHVSSANDTIYMITTSFEALPKEYRHVSIYPCYPAGYALYHLFRAEHRYRIHRFSFLDSDGPKGPDAPGRPGYRITPGLDPLFREEKETKKNLNNIHSSRAGCPSLDGYPMAFFPGRYSGLTDLNISGLPAIVFP